MYGIVLRASAIGCAISASSATATWAAHVGNVDQSQEISQSGHQAFAGYGDWAGGQVEACQTFRVGTTGSLTGLDLMLNNWSFGDSWAGIQIRPTDANGVPLSNDTSVLRTWGVTVPSGQPRYFSATWSAPYLQVRAGDVLAIVVYTNDASGIRWKGAIGDPYPAGGAFGRVFKSPNAKGSWRASLTPAFDLTFRTYVIPVPEAPSCIAMLSSLPALQLAGTKSRLPRAKRR
jgi:hypothetical protein